MPASMGGPALLWLALLLSSPGVMSSVFMNPPWNTILKDDNVTLTCTGNNSLEVDSAVWLHNDITLQKTTSRLDIKKAQIQDSGEYRCRENRSVLSDPVYLTVFTEWLILQASANVVMEGETVLIRCHSWKNLRLTKVTYYKDGTPIKYWYENFNISISNVTTRDSGNYSCSGQIQQKDYTSKGLNIIVKKEPTKQNKYSWLQFLIPFVVVILFAVDTGLFISTKQQLTVLLQIKKTRKNKKPEPGKN
ncbi:high affinity immunoglobulin epsilon receptor subunit alpha isoform X2 [Vulpes lagopus]|uniref:high affinity immunoglobulin epsilon receptor subunit alpha isoform X2 n=1 Tax=Vulpes lagopus TaxID=494514 RepID=UPI001BCA46A2|nr:high affinity immunoglobulin epsilon receptor subunit alpha isoform X2 [Vulpes lagopus]